MTYLRIISIIIILFMIVGCDHGIVNSEPPKAKTTLRVMHFMAEEGAQRWLNDVRDQFKSNFPHVDVEIIYVNADSYHTLLRNKIASDDLPDIFLLARLSGADYIYIRKGLLENLSDQPFLEHVDRIERFIIDDGVYGMPFDLNAYGVLYNKTIFRQAGIHSIPTTYDEFMEALQKIERLGIHPIAAGYQEVNIINSDLLSDLLVSQMSSQPQWRTQIQNREIRFADDDSIRDALFRLTDRFNYTQHQPFQTDRLNSADLVANGKAAMLINGTWFIDSIISQNPDIELGMFPFPHSNDPVENKLPLGSSIGGWAINVHSPVKTLALAFLESMTTEEMITSLQINKKALSIFKPNAVNPYYDVFTDIQHYIDTGRIFDFTAVVTHFNEPYHTQFHQIVSAFLLDEQRDVDDVLRKLDAEFDEIASQMNP